MSDVQRDDEGESRVDTSTTTTSTTGPGLGIDGDLDLGCRDGPGTRIGGGEGEEEACCEKDREAVFSGEESDDLAGGKVGKSPTSSCETEKQEQEKAKKGKRSSGGGAASDEDDAERVEDQQEPSPRSRRVGIVCAPSNYKRPRSLLDLKNNAATTAAITGRSSIISGSTNGSSNSGFTGSTNPPAIPPRSPLRPTPPRHNLSKDTPPTPGPTPRATSFDTTTTNNTHDDEQYDEGTQTIFAAMPMLRDSFGGSLTALLATLEAETLQDLQDKELPLPPGEEDEPSIDYSINGGETEEEEDLNPDADPTSSSESLALDLGVPLSLGVSAVVGAGTTNQPTVMTKRMHALVELLNSERAYASDLALIRDIHIPLALGQPAPFNTSSTPSPPPFSPGSGSGSSSRTVSTASDSSTTSSQLGPPMTRDDVRIIFGNINDLALFSDQFVGRLEDALGGVLEGGSGEDSVGALFLEIIPALEPPYKTYITRHPTALAHLNALPTSPALSAYLSHTRTLASSLTHAWDLPSLLIKPVQRLLKYSLLLGAIINATPDAHGDRAALVQARSKMEEVARGVNEGRRRWEVIREVLSGTPVPTANGTGKSKKGASTVNVGVSVAASAHLSRMKSLRGPKMKDLVETGPDNAEAAEVVRLEGELQKYSAFLDRLAKDVRDWRIAMHTSLVALRQWGITFGAVLGLTPSPSAFNPDLPPEGPNDADPEVRSEAYDAFTLLLSTLPGLSTILEENLNESFIPILCELKSMIEPPTKLLSAMHSLEPLHTALLHTPFSPSKSRRPAPALLTASQSYLALRSSLSSELPVLLSAMNRATGLVVRIVAQEQVRFYEAVGERWAELWDALRVEGERCGGAEETLRVWWERWGEVEGRLSGMKIVRKDKWWAERERELRDGGREFRGEARGEKEREQREQRERESERDGANDRDGRDKPTRRQTAPPTAVNVTAALAALDPPHAPYHHSSPASSHSKRQHHQSHPSADTTASNRKRSGSTSTTTPPTQIHRRPSDESLRSGKSGKSGGKSSRNSKAEDEPPVPRLKPNFSSPNTSSAPHRHKSNPTISPLRTTASLSSQVIVDIEAAYPPSPLSYATFDDEERDRDGRGRSQRRPSFKSKITDSFRPSHHRRRSSSVKSLGAPSSLAPSYHSTDMPLPPYSPSSAHFPQTHASHPSTSSPAKARPSPTLATTRALYTTRVIHACLPPAGVSYRGLPFFALEHGDAFDVLREYGHPSTHVDLPLYVDDGEDCLLLVRARTKGGGSEADVGWALASFLIPVD
ncbi:hypothetical protein HYDPIDRAFT_27311 [Hydnomerulius pinastri MD-312]|nr:hypothetical protein HYDPIDRAFT_27311 [Hydnomerulius pinastri MD-312]